MSDMEAARSFNVNGLLCPPDVGLSGVIDQISEWGYTHQIISLGSCRILLYAK